MKNMRISICKIRILCIMLLGTTASSFAQSFSVQRRGNGEQAIILIPGFACSADVWTQTVDALSENYTCYILTMPGFAGTAPETNPSFDNWTNQIIDFIRDEDIKQPILIGHSMGGGLALNIASIQTNLVKSVIVIDALPCLAAVYNPNFQARKMSDDEILKAGARWLDMSDEQFHRQAYINAISLTTDSLRYKDLVKWSLSSDRLTYTKMYYDYFNVDLRPAIKKISVPTLVLLEHPFKKIGPVIEQQFGFMQNIRLEYADKGLHFIMFDDWEWYIRQIKDFLNN